MHKEGHVGAALLVYAPVGFVVMLVVDAEFALFGAVAAGALAMLPDIDMKLPLIKHRGPTHSFLFALLVGIGTAAVGWSIGADTGATAGIGMAALGLYIGTGTVVSHIAADALTPAGVSPYWPVRETHYSYDITTAANPIANYLLLGIGAAAVTLTIGVAGNVV